MFLFILGILIIVTGSILGSILLIRSGRLSSKVISITISVIVSLLIGGLVIFGSFVVTIEPGSIGRAYDLGGNESDLKVGYNFVSPMSRKYIWDATSKIFTFSQGEAQNDIYGAQTTEKDYIEAVASMTVRIDTARMSEYIAKYSNDSIMSERIEMILKTVSRESIERVIGSYTTAYVMENKKSIGEEAKKLLLEALAMQPIVIETFTIDDLVAPDLYEQSIKEQAQIRMQKEQATLQQQLNEQQALADKIKAEGEATVAKTKAESDAAVRKIAAENAASVAKIEADNQAEVKKVQAEADAEVKKTAANAEAEVIKTKATAEAEATIAAGDAEAKAIEATGEAYKKNPALIELEKNKIQAEVQKSWAAKWSGYSFEGMSGFNFTDLTEIFKGLLIPSPATQTVTGE